MNPALTNPQHIVDTALEPAVSTLYQLSPSSRDAVSALKRQVANRGGTDVPLTAASGLNSPFLAPAVVGLLCYPYLPAGFADTTPLA